MLLGEYAVLQGGHALVCAIDKRIHLQLTPRTDDDIVLVSSLGTYQTTLARLEITAPFQFVLAVFKKYQKQLKNGCTLTIESEFSEQVGLASSAAVTVAALAALMAWLQITCSPSELIQQAHDVVRTVQGLGSGADVAACVLGGIVAYRKEPFMAEKINFNCPLTLIYSGSKVPTVTAVNKVQTFFSSYPELYQKLLHAIDECGRQGIAAVHRNDLSALGRVMTIQQNLMGALGVNTPLLQEIIDGLLAAGLPSAKISGSGLGDCVVGLGALHDHDLSHFTEQGVKEIPVIISHQGVQCEKIGCD
jgi:mevalonate kinase